MIEVITIPSHLAGARVKHVTLSDGDKMLVTDIPHRSFPGEYIAVAEDYVTTLFMSPEELPLFRKLLGTAPESVDVDIALADLSAFRAALAARIEQCRTNKAASIDEIVEAILAPVTK